jgi:hypothetical protein
MKVLPRMFFRKGFLMKHIPASHGTRPGRRQLTWAELALLTVGATLAMHASTQRALPNLLMDDRWQAALVARCRATTGCLSLTVSAVHTSWLGARRQLTVQTTAGTGAQVTATLRDALDWPHRLYVDMAVHDGAHKQVRP